MANVRKMISMEVDEKDLEAIDKGAARDNRSRTNFMVKASLDRAREV